MNNFLILIIVISLLSCQESKNNTNTTSKKLDKPESVIYDASTKLYYIGNNGSGKIMTQSESGELKDFVSGYSSFFGVTIYDGLVYAAEDKQGTDDFVRGFDKTTGKEVFSLSIPNTGQLNDITFDNEGNLYVSDRDGNAVYKVDVKNKSYTTFVAKDVISIPNGLFYNAKTNSLLICNTTESAANFVYDVKLADGSVLSKKLVPYPHLDGIVADDEGNIYVSSWSADWLTSKLIKISNDKMEEVLKNNSGIADISLNKDKNVIDMAFYYDNKISSFSLGK